MKESNEINNMSNFWDYFKNEWLPDFGKLAKKTIGEFTKPI